MHVHFVGELDDGVSVSSHHARSLCEIGHEVSFAPPGGPRRNDLKDVDLIHLVTREQQSTQLFRRLVAARVAGIPMVRFWTGRDVLWAKHHPPTGSIAVALQNLGVVQRCRSQRMVRDLSAIGITAGIGPVVNPNLSDLAQPQPLPKQFSALAYLPSRRRKFCGGEIMNELIRDFPDVRFLILGDRETNYDEYTNVESLGFVDDVTRTILRSTVILQPRLDGTLSRLSLEALSHGRQVICRRQWPFCRRATSSAEFATLLRELKCSPAFNLDGREHVCELYEKRSAVASLCDLLKRMTGRSFPNRRVHGGWIGVATILRSPRLLSPKTFSLPDIACLGTDDADFAALIESTIESPANLRS